MIVVMVCTSLLNILMFGLSFLQRGECIGILDVLQLTHGAFREIVNLAAAEDEDSDFATTDDVTVTSDRNSILSSVAAAMDLKQADDSNSTTQIDDDSATTSTSDETVTSTPKVEDVVVEDITPTPVPKDCKAIAIAQRGDG